MLFINNRYYEFGRAGNEEKGFFLEDQFKGETLN